MSTSYDYYPAVLYAIDQISQGQTITFACDKANITVQTLERYLKNDPALKDMYEEALQRGYDALADALINIDNHKIHGHSDAKMAKVVSDNIKWVLSKRDQKRFGEKIQVTHEITADKAIIAALEAGKRRTALPSPAQVIDVTYEEVPAATTDDDMLRDLLS